MAVFIYNIFLLLYKAGIYTASLFNAKAAKWVQGRKDIFSRLAAAIPAGTKTIWMHCASLGEFEQGRPLLEKMKEQYPDHRFLLTFFSPSGYEVRKNYTGADWVFYLPADGPVNARRFLEIVQPRLVIFVKYEFWYYYLKKIKYRNIPLLLVSALFRKDMSFFSWYGGLQRKMLSRFDQLFVQNPESAELIKQIGLSSICTVSGDTRFDRVIAIAEKFEPIPVVADFTGNKRTLVAGSTWPEDEAVLARAFGDLQDPGMKLIIAPHEISEKHLAGIQKLFPDSVRYSQLQNGAAPEATVLVIDNIGMLSRLYNYGWLTYVGGGMTKNGVHNVLEAAVYNKLVLFGPYYQKYSEAVGLVKSGGGVSFTDDKMDGRILRLLLETLSDDEKEYQYRSNAAGTFVQSHRGATGKIIQFIQEKRLLTN
ncbi:MAG: 3-deoxy-D-manno-octulosonic acid transferase [Sphingobacteriales bacterium]|nr:3-deoxy-D-manno-octulosonic acid transferase [Sphingobacteriales bacterium]